MSPNFTLLDLSRPEVATLVKAMVQARDAVGRGSWSHPQEPTGEEWWADVLADPRARRLPPQGLHGRDLKIKHPFYRLRDEPREIILVACSKCGWTAAFSRNELIALHGADCPMPNLLGELAAQTCSKRGHHWDRCGVYYVEPIGIRGSVP
jgi:hypothetical protein